ncbi:MAG: cobalt-precorrin-6A reductase [Elainella sp. Prado103]|jgi:precorrin-6A/cobalt-precorrin-6A reductase|nr:cobalt-precorrin-6A reductase [Elainella sp. Prado103]
MIRVLILGGTGDAVELAAQASNLPDVEVISSLAGRTKAPSLPIGQVRVGGFGGTTGLADYLRAEKIAALIDATHPFADQISWNAARAAQQCQIPLLIIVRPAWQPVTGDHWIEVESHEIAAQVLPKIAQRIFLTIGRQELSAFAHLTHLWFLMRMIDPPPVGLPVPPGEILLERGPFTLEHEQTLLQTHQIEAIVSKNSGGTATYAKIAAARSMGLPIVMIQRPQMPVGEQVGDVAGAMQWLERMRG